MHFQSESGVTFKANTKEFQLQKGPVPSGSLSASTVLTGFLSNLTVHVNRFHGPSKTPKNPYRFIRESPNAPFICQMGCAYSSSDQNEFIKHLVLWHSQIQLKRWGYSRDYLKELLGLNPTQLKPKSSNTKSEPLSTEQQIAKILSGNQKKVKSEN